MFRKKTISVCIATYNGAEYIKEQLESILPQLNNNDEIIISDDHSTDNTIELIKEIKDSRIVIFLNCLKKGPVKNFENAIAKAVGDYIFLSDQDDIWQNKKVETILRAFEKDESITCVFSNASIIDANGVILDKRFFTKKPSLNLINLIIKNQFLGCTMAFVNNSKLKILPFSNNLPMHDWYIGLKNVLRGKVKFIDKDLIFYRRHGKNVTTGKSSGILTILRWRFQIIKALIS